MRQVTAPGTFDIEMNLPEVRARVDLVHDIQLKREGGVIAAGGAPPLTLFPSTILSDFAAAQAALPPVGLYDPEEQIAPILKEAGVKFDAHYNVTTWKLPYCILKCISHAVPMSVWIRFEPASPGKHAGRPEEK